MPNIEIHGKSTRWEDVYLLVREIHALFEQKDYAGDVVVTICPTQVLDRHENNQPFLRLITTDAQEAAEIIALLQTLEMEIEYIAAAGFYPKRPPKEK